MALSLAQCLDVRVPVVIATEPDSVWGGLWIASAVESAVTQGGFAALRWTRTGGWRSMNGKLRESGLPETDPERAASVDPLEHFLLFNVYLQHAVVDVERAGVRGAVVWIRGCGGFQDDALFQEVCAEMFGPLRELSVSVVLETGRVMGDQHPLALLGPRVRDRRSAERRYGKLIAPLVAENGGPPDEEWSRELVEVVARLSQPQAEAVVRLLVAQGKAEPKRSKAVVVAAAERLAASVVVEGSDG